MPPTRLNLMGGGVDFKIPNVSYCKDANDVHFNPYNLIEFYVGEITGTKPQTVKIYTDSRTSVDVQVSKENKWYSYVLPKNKGLYMIEGLSVKKVVVKANIVYNNVNEVSAFPTLIVEASFKDSNTSKVTDMGYMFEGCTNLRSLDLSNFDTSNVTNMDSMFQECNGLTSLDVSSFDTSKVTNMQYMFSNCNSLTSLDLSSFDTSKVTTMYQIFGGCTNLNLLDLSGWNMSNVAKPTEMFNDCSNLKIIKMVGCTPETINNIKEVKPSAATIVTE